MGGFLPIGYCFPYCFLEIFEGAQSPHYGMGALVSIQGKIHNLAFESLAKTS